LNSDIETIAGVLENFNVIDIVLAEDNQRMAEIWALRRCIGEAVKSISAYKEEDTVVPREEDTVVPRSKIPELVSGVKEICERYGITSICYGHAGDGNVHVNILKGNATEDVWNNELEPAIEEIFKLTVSLGGTISGEHGIGYSQKKYLPIAMKQNELDLMKQIKINFDPNNILNPGKIFV